ncbi:MAG: hypothetical protein K5989_03195 [Lachnospiraceae bacterium]|nr:hypothetical protein [Lachnospiraceae bacterium]
MHEEIANNLTTFKGHIEEFEKGYRSLVNDFDALVQNMHQLNSMWVGDSHDALMQRFEEDRVTVQGMADYIRDILNDLKYADSEYVKCENEVANIIDSIRV